MAHKKSISKNAVIVRAGIGSLHLHWLQGKTPPQFDLIVAAYEEGVTAPDHPGVSLLCIPGPKIAGYNKLFALRPDLLEQYDYIALFDDDVFATADLINRLFAVGLENRLDLFQPALTWDSYFSYAATLGNPTHFRLRYTNAVEMMCPVFTRDHLKIALPLFRLGYETGIDLLWTRLTDYPLFRYAIVDEVVVKHTRKVGATRTQQGFHPDYDYDPQIMEVLMRFGTSFYGFVTYAAIKKDGNPVLSRALIAWYSLYLWKARHTTPLGKCLFARSLTDYTRHCLARPINLGRVQTEQLP